MQQKPFSLSSTEGFTLLELLVVMGLGMLLLGMCLGAALSNRQAFLGDLYRTQLSQNLRGAMDIVAAATREAGENLPPGFPAIEIVNGANGGSDELVIRRNLIDEVLKVCVDIIADDGSNRVYFSTTGGVAGCSYSDQLHNFTTWRSERTLSGGTLRAYVYNQAADTGEFFDVTNEIDTGSDYYLESASTEWSSDYPVASSAVYYLEEWRLRRFEIGGIGFLQIVENEDLENPINVARDISDLAVVARLSDNTDLNAFDDSNDWTSLRYVEVTLAGLSRVRNFTTTRSLTGRYFPRNVLSH